MEEPPESAGRELTVNDLFIKDAFLVFRALCKLTMKPLNNERSAVSIAMSLHSEDLTGYQ